MTSHAPRHAIACGDVLEVLRGIPDNTFHGMLSDPPYGLEFMGKDWDREVPGPAVWREVLRTCRPGAHGFAFGGARTWHQLATAIEDSGWEILPSWFWVYATGMNSGSKAVDAWPGYGTVVPPACEPIVFFRKRLEGTVEANCAKWGAGAIALDACRLDRGSLPKNVVVDPEFGEMLDASVGRRPSTLAGRADGPQANPSKARGPRTVKGGVGGGGVVYADDGGPSRFFFSAKVSQAERNAGLEGFPLVSGGEATGRKDGSAGVDRPQAGAGRGGGSRNPHPTLKPLALAAHLARLLLPPGPDATLLVPYSGVGSELAGALQAGWPRALGIERDPEYVRIAEARLTHHVYKKGTK